MLMMSEMEMCGSPFPNRQHLDELNIQTFQFLFG
jgi:hypothetical protein